jgi:hypothetical protein
MSIEIFPIAEADVVTLMKSINRVIINPVIFFLFAVAMVYFLWGVAQYFLSPDSTEVRAKSKAQMIWGIIGLFIMVAVFGIMQVVVNTFGITNVKIQNNGDYAVTVPDAPAVPNYDLTDTNRTNYSLNNSLGSWDPTKNMPPLTSGKGTKGYYYVVSYEMPQDGTVPKMATLDGISVWAVGDIVYFDGSKWIKKYITTIVKDPTKEKVQSPPLVYDPLVNGDPAIAPFKSNYQPSTLCWRKAVVSQSLSEYQASASVENLTRAAYLSGTGQTEQKADKKLPIVAERKTLYDPTTANYFVWWAVVAPINGGTLHDCRTLPFPTAQSKKANPITGTPFGDTSTYYTATDSGVGPSVVEAKSIAIQNALIQIATRKGLTSTAGMPYGVLVAKYYPPDPVTGNIDYWVTIESPN